MYPCAMYMPSIMMMVMTSWIRKENLRTQRWQQPRKSIHGNTMWKKFVHVKKTSSYVQTSLSMFSKKVTYIIAVFELMVMGSLLRVKIFVTPQIPWLPFLQGNFRIVDELCSHYDRSEKAIKILAVN